MVELILLVVFMGAIAFLLIASEYKPPKPKREKTELYRGRYSWDKLRDRPTKTAFDYNTLLESQDSHNHCSGGSDEG
jgi:hypothetical protein